jgi:hypothetical protein
MNSFLWFGAMMAVLAVVGFIRGDEVIRDPGQVRESNLAVFYAGAAIIMVLNGLMSHRQAMKAHEDDSDGSTETSASK